MVLRRSLRELYTSGVDRFMKGFFPFYERKFWIEYSILTHTVYIRGKQTRLHEHGHVLLALDIVPEKLSHETDVPH